MVDYVSKKHFTIVNALVFSILSVFALAVAVIFFWLFDSRTVVEVHSAYPIKESFALGEPIVIEERLEVKRQCQGSVSRSIVDESNIAYPVRLPSDPLLGAPSERVRIEFQMPRILGPGTYRYVSDALWSCNPLRPISQGIADVKFVVAGATSEYTDPLFP